MEKRTHYLGRLAVLSLYLGTAVLFAPPPVIRAALSLFGALILYIIWMETTGAQRADRGPLYFRLSFDILILTGMVHLTGDVRSFFLVGYGLIVVFRSASTDPAFGRSAIALSVLALGALCVLLGFGLLEPARMIGGPAARRTGLEYLAGVLAVALSGILTNEFIGPLFRTARTERERAERESTESRLDLVLSEKARYELETFSEFARRLNSTDSFEQIIDQIFDYITANFSMEGTVLYLVDRNAQVFYPHRMHMPPEAPPENVEYMRSWTIPFSEEGGMHWHACRRKKPVYLPHLKQSPKEADKVGVNLLELRSILMVPLVVRDEVFGIIDFTNYKKKLNLSREDINSIALFCEQIAGAIRSSQLVHEAQLARKEMEESKAEIQRLNEISQRINAISNLDEILETIFGYIKEQFAIEGIWLQFIDQDNQELYTYKSTRPTGISEEQLRYIRALRVPLKPEGGLAFRVYERQKPFYMARVPKNFLTEIDRRNAETLRIEAALYMPLVINNECVAIISFTQFHKKMKLSQETIDSLARFCEQIAGAINNSRLHTETEFSRIIAEEHLQEIRKLKSQQDLDYFLTSQLIEPLAGIHIKSETVNIEQFTRQKKNFPFKAWHCEIGGDINLAYSIAWDNRPYTVFLNADAMGKSIQGAGGILVLGSAFRIIIDRTEKTKYKYPEQWLKNTYQELDRIFETFEGGMYITTFIGMIDDNTGWMYWINVEHPHPVLYRNKKAEIIDARFRLNKLGFTLGKSLAAVNMMQLKTGDQVFLGSDGREDVVLHGTVDIQTGEGEFNRDDNFFGSMIEKADGDLKQMFSEIRLAGQIMDDVSFLKISYENDNALPGDILNQARSDELSRGARKFLAEGRTPDAIALLKKAAERILDINTPLDSEFTQLYDPVLEPYIEALFGAGKFKETLRVVLAYSSLNPGCTLALEFGAKAAARLDNLDLAADIGERVFLREPDRTDNLVALIETHINMRSLDRAKFLLNELAKKKGRNEDISDLTGKLEKARTVFTPGGTENQERRKREDRRGSAERRRSQGRRNSDADGDADA